MKIEKRGGAWLLLFFLFTAASILGAFRFADSELVNRIITQLSKFNKTYAQEKVFLHLDKPYYVAGEDIWYKAYLVKGSTHVPDSVSKTLYVELISPDGEIVEKNILQIKAGMAAGDFDLSDSLEVGTYQLRAYTNWMRNFPAEYFFRQDIRIWNDKSYTSLQTKVKVARSKQIKLSEKEILPDLDVQFFPEGGNLVAGIDCKVGFKAVNKFGKGEDISGRVVDNTGKEVMVFSSAHLGMGSFLFQPEAGKTYTSYIKAQDGREFTVPFPAMQEQGFVMQVNNFAKDAVRVGIFQNVVKEEAGRNLVLVAHIRGVICYIAELKATSQVMMSTIPKSKFPTGMVQLTLFDKSTSTPLCERLIFINNQDDLKLTIKPDKTRYKSRELVKLSIAATDSKGNPVATSLSLAVTDGSMEANPYHQNLVNYLLLSSDLKGAVEQPGFYFKDTQMATLLALDNLLLTQGWRRFIWHDLLAGKYPEVKYDTERGLAISGQVNRLLTNKPLPNAKVIISVFSPENLWIQTQANDKGHFYVSGLEFYGQPEVLIQGQNEKGKQSTLVLLDKQASAPLQFLSPVPSAEEKSPVEADYIRRMKNRQRIEDSYTFRNGERVLKEVVIKGEKPEEANIRRLHRKADNILKMDETASSYGTVLQVIQGKFAGIYVSGAGPTMKVSIRGGGTPLLLLDGMPTDLDMINSINPVEVETIEVLKGTSAAIYGIQGGNGVIAVYLKRGYSGNSRDRRGIISAKIPGYYTARQFYAPKYNIRKEEHDLPDRRSTLYWNPMVKTDAAGKAMVSFYNADEVTSMRAIVSGVSDSGLLGSTTFLIGQDY